MDNVSKLIGSVDREAMAFAKTAHHGQTRKGTGEPYFGHVARVAKAMIDMAMPAEVIAAAYLHDTLEDTDTSFEELELRFGSDVAMLVLELTDHFTPEDYPQFNRAVRKKAEADRLADVSPMAKIIKIADIMDNTRNVRANLPGFADVYLAEKEYLLHRLMGGRAA